MGQVESKTPLTEEDRTALREGFVRSGSWKNAEILPLQQDVSVRRFFRLKEGEKTAILMDARPPLENTAMYEFVRNKFDKIGLNVPEIYEADHEHGFVIMEDFGDTRCFEYVSNDSVDNKEMYTIVVDALVKKHFADPKVALEDSVAYSDDYWLFRVEQFLLHYMPQVVGRAPTEGERKSFLSIFRDAIEGAHTLDDVLLHGDYGVQNIYYYPEREGIDRIGLIDFQDMTDARGNMMGSPAFDLAFLLNDPRTPVPAEMAEAMKQHFIDKVGFNEEEARIFNSEYATIATAQSVKCLGLFARLGYVEGRTEYLPFLENCKTYLQRHFTNPDLAPIKNWFEKANVEIG